VNGQILVQDSELRIQADPGFMLMLLKGPIAGLNLHELDVYVGVSSGASISGRPPGYLPS
jgi:hypothetical protein